MSEETEAKKVQKEWTATVNFAGFGPMLERVWVIKLADGKYVRATTNMGLIATSRRMATRFDSRTWAHTIAVTIAKSSRPRLVRLVTKVERKLSEPQTFAYSKPADPAATRSESEGP